MSLELEPIAPEIFEFGYPQEKTLLGRLSILELLRTHLMKQKRSMFNIIARQHIKTKIPQIRPKKKNSNL